MKRIWIFALPIVLWCCLAFSVAIFTNDPIYLAWGVFLPPVLALIYAVLPRRGMQYAYWNRYLAVFGVMLLGIFAIPIISGYVTLKLDTPQNVFVLAWLLGWIIWIPGFILWFKFYFMPSWGPWRLRSRYPKMVASASRLKKFGESYIWYFPLILVQEKPYLVVGYSVQQITGIATLDEEGQFVKDEALALVLLRCYKLAMAVLHMPDSYERARDIDSHERTERQVKSAFQRLRKNEAYFQSAGQPIYGCWKSLCLFEPYVHSVIKTQIYKKLWQAKWAVDHGLNKLTEVSDKQLYEAEESLATFNRLLVSQIDHLNQIVADAEMLLKYVQGDGKSRSLKYRSTIEEMLKSLIILRQGTAIWKEEVTDFMPLKSEWLDWQSRKRMAEKLEIEGRLF
jgi:hypothetical protein